MQLDNLQLKISYRRSSSQPDEEIKISRDHLKVNTREDTIISIPQIIKRINSYIQQEIQTEAFLEIFVKTSDGFHNIYQFLKGTNHRTFQLSKEGNSFVLQIQLRQNLQKESQEELVQWEKQLKNLYQRVEAVSSQVKKKQQKLEEFNKKLIDLAFFYAEPLVEISNLKIRPTSKEVSFQQEESKFVRTLRNKEKVVRDAFIEINVATIKNIKQALKNGVQILHFSCHGTANKLVIEDSEDIGLRYDLKTADLIQLLEVSPPNIIVFNVCFSVTVAEQIHKHSKHITTIGYQGKANDRYCQIFAEVFYPQLFTGTKVRQAFELTQKQMGEAGTKLKIFSDQDVKIETSKIGLNHEKCLQILSHNQPMEEVLYGVRFQIYQFITKYLNDTGKRVIFFNGPPKHGKSLFIKKCLLYLKQRKKKFQNFHIVNLNTPAGYVNSMAWLREDFEQKIRDMYKQQTNTILVLDHCDQIIKNQEREFIFYLKEIQKNSMVGKIIIITNCTIQINTMQILSERVSKKQFVLSDTDFWQFITYKGQLRFVNKMIQNAHSRNQSKIGYPPHIHEKVLAQIKKQPDHLNKYWVLLKAIYEEQKKTQCKLIEDKKNQIKRLSNYIKNLNQECKQAIDHELSKLQMEFLVLSPIISIINISKKQFPQFIPLSKRRSQLTDDLDLKIDTFLQKMEELIQNFADDYPVKKILKEFYDASHYILGFKILPYLIGTSNHFTKKKFIHAYRKLMGFCLTFKRIVSHREQKLRLMTLQIKLLLLMLCITQNEDSQFYSTPKRRIYEKIINKKLTQFSQINTKSVLPVGQLVQIYNYIMKIKPHRLGTNIEHEDNELYRFSEIQRYRGICMELKIYYEKQPEIMQCQNQFQGLYGQNQLQMMILPMVNLIKGYLQINQDQIDLRCIESLLIYCQDLDFLLQNLQGPCSHIYMRFIEPHIFNLFTLKKLQMSKITKPKQIRRSQIVEQFTEWVRLCSDYNLKHLKTTIQRYKQQSFNSCVAFTSVPVGFRTDKNSKNKNDPRIIHSKFDNRDNLILVNPYRFQNSLYKMMIDTFRKMQKTIFPRMDIFNLQSIKKYNQDNLPILIAFFLVDCSHDPDLCEIFIQNQQGLSQIVYPKQIDFYKSAINIFCGANTTKIRQYLEESKQQCKKDTVFIFIDVIMEEEKGVGYLKKRPNDAIYQHIRNRKILMVMAQGFYNQFCNCMFKENHQNFIDQVTKSFQVGKARARIQGNMKFGHYFHQIVGKIYDQITILIKRNQKILPPPLKISQINKSVYEDENAQQLAQFGFNQELYEVLNYIKQCFKKYSNLQFSPEQDNFYLIEYEKEEEQKLFIESLKIKVRKMGHFSKIQDRKSDCVHESAATANSNIRGQGSKLFNKQRLQFPDSFIVYRNAEEKLITKAIRNETEIKLLYENQQKKPHRFLMFTGRSDNNVEGVKSRKLNKFKNFNLLVYYYEKTLQKFLATKGKSQEQMLKGCIKFFEGEGKNLDTKEKRDKILEKSLH